MAFQGQTANIRGPIGVRMASRTPDDGVPTEGESPMSRLGLISDVHGDVEALESAWSRLTDLGAELILCAGDVVGYGPRPDEAAAFLEEKGIASVRGNHDRWALERGEGRPDEFGGGTPSSETLRYLEGLRPSHVAECGGRVVAVVHGSPRGDMEFVSPSTHPSAVLEDYLAILGVDVLVLGHTHRPMWLNTPGGLVVNPGSVVTRGRVESSRTCALVELDELRPVFLRVTDGREPEVVPWPSGAEVVGRGAGRN